MQNPAMPILIADHPGHMHSAMVPMWSETHSAEDVSVHATGPWSHLFSGTTEQHYLPHAIMYATCTNPGPRGEHCDESPQTDSAQSTSSVISAICVSLLISVSLRRSNN